MHLANNQYIRFLPISAIGKVFANKPNKPISHICLTGNADFSH